MVIAGSFSQTTVTIGTGTSTGYIYGPIYRGYASSQTDYCRYNYLYIASELAAAGIPTGSVITRISWYKADGFQSLGDAVFNIWMKNSSAVNQTNLTPWGTIITNSSLAYSTTAQSIPVNTGWIDFDLTSPFTYTGNSLEIATDWDISAVSGNASTGSFKWNYATGLSFNGTLGWSGNTAPTNASTLNSTLYGGLLRPNIRITYTDPNSCQVTPSPGNTISSANPTCAGISITISVQNPSTGNGVTYQWQTSPDGAAPWTNVGTSTSLYATNQFVDTWYRCVVSCNGNSGISTPLLVTVNPFTSCYCPSQASATANEEIFSVSMNGSTNAYDCFTVAPGPGSILNRYSNFYPLGSLCNMAKGSQVYFVIVEDDCDGAPYTSNGCAVWIDFNHDGDFLDAGEQLYYEPSIVYGPRTISNSFTVPAGALTGQTGMRITVAGDYYGSVLTPCLAYTVGETEDYLVNITEAPTCPSPTALNTSGITTSSALLDWTNNGTATLWNVKYGPPGFNPDHTGTLISGLTAHPYLLNPPLSPNTSYDWYVQSDCGSGNMSLWAGPMNFKTLCSAIPPTDLPWTENFDNMVNLGTNIFPDCWKTISISGTSPWWTGNANSFIYNDPCSPPNYAYVSFYPYPSDKYLVTPGFSLKSGNSYDFKFNWVGDGYSGWNGNVLVNSAQSATGATILGDPFITSSINSSTTCATISRSFSPPATGTYYFMVNVYNNDTPHFLGFDDFMLMESPNCYTPNTLTSLPYGFQAILGWTGNGVTSDIEYGVVPYSFTGIPTVTGVNNPFTLTGLTPSTSYTYRVRSNCGGGVYSNWSDSKDFTTTVACPAPVALVATGITSGSALLGWTETGLAGSWDIELGYAGFTPSGTPTVSGITANPYQYGNLAYATSYSFYVRAACGGVAGYSAWTGPYTFTTLCEARNLPFCQNFNASLMPSCWSQTTTGTIPSTAGWVISNTSSAGGTPEEMKCAWANGTGISRLTSPQIMTTGESSVHMSFRQMFDDFGSGGNLAIKVQTRFNSGAWATVWSHAGGGGASIPSEIRELDIPVTGDTLEVSWAVDGNHYNFNFWYIDDVCFSTSQNVVVTGTISSTVCYGATNSITVAGGGSTCIVSAPGGAATFIAGQDILFLPGTMVNSGAYMLAYISTNLCNAAVAPVSATGVERSRPSGAGNPFTLYPNPTTGKFILGIQDSDKNPEAEVRIFNSIGELIRKETVSGVTQMEFDIENYPTGMYLVEVKTDRKINLFKLLKIN